MEIAVLDFIQVNMRTEFLDFLMPLVSLLGNKGAVWLAMAVIMIIIPRCRKAGVAMLIALAAGFLICNLTLKPIVARVRPFDIAKMDELLIKAPRDFSFPSGHTTASFAAASALLFIKNRGWIFVMIFAALMAFSRMYLYVHFPTDILGGIIIGFICGYIGVKGALYLEKILKFN